MFKLSGFTFFILFVCCQVSHGQLHSYIDSCITELQKYPEDTNKIALLCRISQDYSTINPTAGLKYGQQALALSNKLNYRPDIALSYNSLGVNYWLKSDYTNAIENFFKALQLYEDWHNKIGAATIASNIALVYHEKGDLQEALKYYQKAEKNYLEIGNKSELARNWGNMGTLYVDLHDNNKALEYFNKALTINKDFHIQSEISVNLVNIASAYAAIGEYEKAVNNAFESLKMAEEIGDLNITAACYALIGETYLDIMTKKPGIITTSAPQIPRGKQLLLSKSFEYLNKSLTLLLDVNPKEAINVYEYLATAYELAGNYKESYLNYKKAIVIKDSIFSEENARQIARLEAKSEYEKVKLADSLKYSEGRKIATLKLQRQKAFTYFGALGVVSLLIFSFFIYKERKKSDALLLNILPSEVASELKRKGETEARYFDDVTILFTDFVNFTGATERMSSKELVEELNACFKAFDTIISKYKIEKIKTIGDAYLAVCGLPAANNKHAENTVAAACEIRDYMLHRRKELGDKTFEIRIGVHSGNVVAGIVGIKKFAYDIWGDTVNTAARMEQNSLPGKINISQVTYDLVKNSFDCNYRGELAAKNKGQLNMYFVEKPI